MLDVTKRLHDGVEERRGGVVASLALPIREGVGEQDVGCPDDSIGGAVLELVPAVRGADTDSGKGLLHVLDLVGQLGAGEVAAVEGLGADRHGVHLVLKAGDVLQNCGLVGGVGLLRVGPPSESVGI